MTRHTPALLVFSLTMLHLSPASATDLTTGGIGFAAEAVIPVAAATARDVVHIVGDATNVLYIPQGAVKTAASVLPGVSSRSGMRDINRGLRAVSRVIGKSIQLPFRTVNRTVTRLRQVSPVNLARSR